MNAATNTSAGGLSALKSFREVNPGPRPGAVFVAIPLPARLAILGFCVCYLFLLALGASFYALENRSTPLLLVTVIGYFISLLWPILFYRSEYGWAHPLVLNTLFTVLNVVFRSTGLYTQGLTEHEALPGWTSADLTALLAYEVTLLTVGQIALLVGYSLGPRVRALPISFGGPRNIYPKLGFFTLVAALAFLWYLRGVGSLEQHILNFSRGRAKIFEADIHGIGQYVILMSFSYAVCLTWLAVDRNAIRNPLFWLSLAFALALSYLEMGRRSAVIQPIILCLIIWMLRSKRTPVFSTLILAGALFFLFGAAGSLRQANFSGNELKMDSVLYASPKELIERNFLELSLRSGSGSAVYPILAMVPKEVPLLYGRSYLENFYRFIPRQIYPDKPVGIDTQANMVFFGGDWGRPPGILGEAYWNFHIFGVILIFFLFGTFKRWWGEFYIRYNAFPAAAVLYAINIFLFSPAQNSIRVWLFYLITSVLVMSACGLFKVGGSIVRR
jgi:oligosaccharide repeat unit polymerase